MNEAKPTDPVSEADLLRLRVDHLQDTMRRAAAYARNSIRTNSKDRFDWIEDMEILADCLERQMS